VPKDKTQIAFTGTPEYRKWIGDRARERDIKVQKLLERAVAAYVQEPVQDGTGLRLPDPAITPENEREEDLVAGVLAVYRNKAARRLLLPAIEALLDVWRGTPKRKNGTEAF
jgi:hypothetical protein